MFSTGHLIWIALSLVIVPVGSLLFRNNPISLNKLIRVCFILGLISEIVKIVSVITIVPVVDAAVVMQNGQPVLTYITHNDYTPMLGAEHLPLELCSLQLIFMLIVIITKNKKLQQNIFAIMYPTGLIGGLVGIILSGTAPYATCLADFFTSPRMLQYFLYHIMIVWLSICIGMSRESGLVFKKWRLAISALILLDIPTFYLNSVLSDKVYVNGELIGATHRINIFSSYVNPLGLVLTEKWQWLLYLLIRLVVAVSLVIAVFLPFRKRKTDE